jgi:hypothetical protein
MDTSRHNPEEPVFRLEETDRRTKIARLLMALIILFVAGYAMYASGS